MHVGSRLRPPAPTEAGGDGALPAAAPAPPHLPPAAPCLLKEPGAPLRLLSEVCLLLKTQDLKPTSVCPVGSTADLPDCITGRSAPGPDISPVPDRGPGPGPGPALPPQRSAVGDTEILTGQMV